MSEPLGMIHPEAKFFSISGLVELENKLSVPKTQWWDRHRLRVIDIPIPKGRKRKEKKVSLVPGNGEIQQCKFHSVSRPGNNKSSVAWCSTSGSRLCPQSHSFFPLKGSTCLLLSSFSLYPSSKILGVQNPSFISSCLCFFFSKPIRQCFHQYNILKNLLDLPWKAQGFTSLDKRVLLKFFMDNPISIPDFYWDGWEDPWVTHKISLVLAKGCPATPLAFSPEHTFLTMNLLNFMSFAIWTAWEFSKSSNLGSILLNSSSLNLSLSFHILL